MSAPAISIDDLVAARANGTAVPLIDVRQPDEYDAGHVPGARSIPLGEVVARAGEVPTEGPVYVICQSGGRSQRAADYYQSLGIDIYNVAGGTKAWADAGHDLARGPLPG